MRKVTTPRPGKVTPFAGIGVPTPTQLRLMPPAEALKYVSRIKVNPSSRVFSLDI